MTTVPSPISLMCFMRGIVWSIGLCKPVKGHRFVETERSDGQPRCVRVMHCRDCGTVSVGWETCSRC